MYNLATAYYNKYNNLEIPYSFKTLDGINYDENGYSLGIWITKQRQTYKNRKLSQEKIELLDKIDMRFETKNNIKNKISWEEYCKLAKVYYNKYNNLEVPARFKTLDGITYDENGYKLGFWISRQRQSYKMGKLSKEQIELLGKIDMRFENKKNIIGWEENYKLAKAYFEKNNNLEIPRSFKTLDGIKYNENGYSLEKWITKQRQAYKSGKLSKEKIELLEKIGMRFENKRNNIGWEEYYKLAKAYYNKYNNLEVPARFKTLDGINYAENGYSLGEWITTQRKVYRNSRLNKEKIELLEKIGMRFENKINNIGWEEYYKLANAYFKKNNNLEISRSFKTQDGINYDEKGYNLGRWINTQREDYRNEKLSKERIDLLKKIGMRFENKKNTIGWEEYYKLTKAYFEKNNNSEVPQSFKTLDGITYDEKGYNLGAWIRNQRQSYKNGKLNKERIELLDKIGMVWSIRKRTDKKNELCEEYQIPYEEVQNISYQELYAKTMYLIDNNVLVTNNGILNPIYNMSNINMEIRYKVTLEELINKYTKKEKEK